MDLYRMIRSKSLWICLGCIVFFIALAAGLLAYATSPAFLETMTASGNAHIGISAGTNFGISTSDSAFTAGNIAEAQAMLTSTSQITFIGTMMIKGGALAMVFIIFVAIFLGSEFETGFSKNVFASHPNRLAFLGARLVEIVALAAVFTAVTIVSSLVSMAVTGFELAPAPVGDMVLWAALVTLVISAFAMITALVIWVTRKMSAGIVVGVLLVSGMVSALIKAVLSLFPSVSHVGDFMLGSCMESLGTFGLNDPGALSVPHVAGVGLAFLVACTVLSAVALKKKDI